MVIKSGSISNENTVNINGVSGEDLSSPLYMHPSDNPGVSFVQTLFDGVGYRSRKRNVLRVLSVKNKLGFINGDCKRLDPGTSHFRQWGRCDDMVPSWILSSLSKEIAESVKYVSDSVELWKELKNRYDQTNGVKLYQDEKQREIKHNAQVFMKSTSLNASNSRKKVMESVAFNTNGSAGASTFRSMRANNSSTGNKNPNFIINYSQTNSYIVTRTHIICDYYKKPGNTRDKCYKLHVYPQTNNPQTNNYQNSNTSNHNGYRGNNQNPRFNKGKGLMDDVHGGCCSGEEGHMGTHADTDPQLTREQYAQFVELLQQFQAEKDNAFTIGNVNFAGSFNEEASDTMHIDIESPTVQHVENDVLDASDLPSHTSPNHVTNSHVTIQPSNPEHIASSRPSRPHKLPTYLHDYVLPKTMAKQLQNSNISLNTTFSKHQHVPLEVLALESQTTVRNVSNDDEPSSYREAAMNHA
ncbi:uncharacterized protein LOC125859209 [Solanum stenotomum]|uniref:uncharacterized protein LOC125859209 n=1 Tax=Solanum stenotomum TaxID=172797 RepID=UPI0020D0DE3A|nr:uncharacterized protein LOC125859209 [Solanum stenotomum]